ncbi:hypothetical protein SELMODRAFT_76242 [Selaginella moellendorffii]|uniref:Amino acid permease/ SLC12A domain-containing protein n=1 Tax=Selaginella moellendorffii TaxID=88036 RepID=D8QSS9_SELML|nr:amino-acid permease BAT1 homolog [Selaginella moellendorffii]EFJ37495.1 hypothetical protein SELMODRAFT_76242 [Selaginella moellendorffii]|eukprot:XP_002962235.1 amino-acid permease BAT1 homolog [Selaginella moellendorffii]
MSSCELVSIKLDGDDGVAGDPKAGGARDPNLDGARHPKLDGDEDERRLNELGYKQEYRRVMTPFQQFAYTFSYTAPLGFVTGYYGYMYCYGGPLVIFWGMLVTTLGTLSVLLAIAEVYSTFPTLGSVYYWVAQLCPGMHWLSWLVGWIYLVGALCGTALNEYLLAKFAQKMILLSTGGAQGGGFNLSSYQVTLVTTLAFAAHLGVSVVSSKWLGYLSSAGAWFQMAATFIVGVTLLGISPKFQSPKFVFTEFVRAPGQELHSSWMIAAAGLPYFQAMLTGFDVGSHIVEEVKTAAIAGPRAMIRSAYLTAGIDMLLLFIMTFCIQKPENLLAFDTATGGGLESAGIQLFYDCFEARFKRGNVGAVLFTGLAATSLFFANIINVTLTARCVYAMARDASIPFQAFLTRLTAREKVPVNATFATVAIAFLATLPSSGSSVAFTAIAAMSTVTAWIPYIIVLFCKHAPSGKKHPPGPYTLHGFGVYLGAWGSLWGILITILFCLPPKFPIGIQSFNYTPLSLVGTIGVGVVYWQVYGKWTYTGPRTTLDEKIAF